MVNRRRRLTGTVVSNKMDKSVVVQVDRSYRHPLYGKTVHERAKFMAHDENNACEMGDEVVIVESRPLSKRKRWVVQEILREDASARAIGVDAIAAVPEAVAGAVSAAAETVAGVVTDVVEKVSDLVTGDDEDEEDDEENDEADDE